MKIRAWLTSVLTIVTAALVSLWPALLNRYPLLYPDSLSYLGQGRGALVALLRRGDGYEGMRSELYSMGIYLVHWGRSPWPVIVLQALLAAWVMFLVVKAVLPHATLRVLTLSVVLSLLTSMSWYASLVMPDLLGALVYLKFGLVVFGRESLSTMRRLCLCVAGWWCLVSHATHLVLGVWVLFVLALFYVCGARLMQGRGRALVELGVVLVVAVASQFAVHGRIYGKPTLNGNLMPYVTGRFLADGPAARYLQTHCARESWLLCRYRDRLPTDEDDLLFGDTTIWTISTPAEKEQLLREEKPLVWATLKTYPREQIGISLHNFYDQLTDFGVNDFDDSPYLESSIEGTMPGAHAAYERSLQSQNRVPTQMFTDIQRVVVYAAAVALLGFAVWCWRREDWQLSGLCVIVISAVIANAFLVAVFSSVDSRYQARVIWLVPLMALMMLYRWGDERRGTEVAG